MKMTPSPVQPLDAIETIINKHPFMAGMDPNLCVLLYDCASIRRFASQQVIFHEGTEADHFYLVISGKVALEAFIPGSRMITVQELGPGEALGWSWLFPPYQWHFTAVTREPTDVISLDALKLRAQASQNHQFSNELLSRVAQSLYDRLLGTLHQLVESHVIHAEVPEAPRL